MEIDDLLKEDEKNEMDIEDEQINKLLWVDKYMPK